MKNFRTWGNPPYTVAVIHGGPGAPGSMAPVARDLSRVCGILEPLQTKSTLDEQVEELRETLLEHGNTPTTVIGWSHGSSLSCLLVTRYPDIVRKLILIGTTPFSEKYQVKIGRNMLSRLSDEERNEFIYLAQKLQSSSDEERNDSMLNLARLASKTESYAPLPHDDAELEIQPEIMISIGSEWRKLLDTSEMLKIIPAIKCPLVAMQGDYDVNPAEAVREQFAGTVPDFKFILLEKCGHSPWYEKYARDTFFKLLKEEVAA